MTLAQKGYSLLEVIAVLAIIMIAAGLAAPRLDAMAERNKAAAGINWLIRAVRITRLTAITQGTMTTLCPTTDRHSCGGAWHDEVMVFTDHNDDRRVNGSDHIVAVLTFPYENATIMWRAFRNRQYLQMMPTGFTNYQNGNFVYCPKDQDLRFARQIVLNMQGRFKKSYDRDGDGLIEDRYGKHLRC